MFKGLFVKYFPISLIWFSLLGFFVPWLDNTPDWVLIALLAGVLFIACFRIHITEMTEIRWSSILLFYVIRYLIFPVVFFYGLNTIVPTAAPAMLLLALMPPGTSSPAFSHLFNGNVTLTFIMLVVISLLTPILLPTILTIVSTHSVTINVLPVFIDLSLAVVLPFGIFYIFRHSKRLYAWTHHNGAFYSVVLVGLTYTIAVAKRKDIILHQPTALILPFILTSIAFLLFYVLGWITQLRSTKKNRVTYAICSGANNLSLGITIALLYFPHHSATILITGILPWILTLIPLKWWIESRH